MRRSRAEKARGFLFGQFQWMPNDPKEGEAVKARDKEGKDERLWKRKGDRPEALKNLNFFQKKLKKGVDKGLQVWYYGQARSNGGTERGRVRESGSEP